MPKTVSQWNVSVHLGGRKRSWIACLALVPPLLASSPAFSEVTEFKITPSLTDPKIKTFDSPHFLYVNRDIVVDHKEGTPRARRELLLWLTGTGGKAAGASAFCTLAANHGYHVVSLMYPDEIPATVCHNDADPKAFENFRLAIIQGGRSKHISVERPESIENRLIKLLLHLRLHRPKENWGQFLTENGGLRWGSIAVAGQSQGGGHAALIGVKHRVARVVCTGAPKDYSRKLRAPAAWYQEVSATPKERFFVFNHKQDVKGCTPDQQASNLHALGLDAFGKPADAAIDASPYGRTRILWTSYPPVAIAGENSEGAKAAHSSVIANQNADRWKEAWTYLLTEPVK